MLGCLWFLALLTLVVSTVAAGSLDLPVRGAGISFGNSTNFHGIRFNAVDHHVEDLSGLGLTFWKPRSSPQGRMRGIYAGIVGQRADELTGIGIGLGGLGCGADEVRGLAIGGLCVRAGDLSGAGISAYTRVRGTQQGLTIGLVNVARVLHGVQLGVINYAGNNPAPFKVLPLINVNFSDS